MTELNNIQDIEKVLNILKTEDKHLSKSYLSCCFLVFHISHRKAINKFIKNGFSLCLNPAYIQKDNIIIYKKCVSYADYFLCRISLNDYEQLKINGIPEILNNQEENKPIAEQNTEFKKALLNKLENKGLLTIQ